MTTKTLSDLLTRHEDIITRQKATRARLAKIAEEREAVMDKATGPDDEAAIASLNLLASQETLANRELALTERQFQGSEALLLNESHTLRERIFEELTERREKLLERLDAALAKSFPALKQRTKIVESFNYGQTPETPQPPTIAAVHKATVGLKSHHYSSRDMTPEAYAKSILGAAERALAALSEK